MTKLFLDSSIWVAASASSTGGSAYLLQQAGKDFEVISSKTVLAEAEKNVKNKLQQYHLQRFFRLVNKSSVAALVLSRQLLKQAQTLVPPKDSFILAEAKASGADYFLTFDRKHFLQPPVKSFLKPAQLLTPGDFIESFYR